MLTRKRNVSSNVTMSVRKNSLIDKPTERVVKMSDVKTLKQVKCITDEYVYVTKGCVYTVLSTNGEHLRLICDGGVYVTYHKDGFVDVEEVDTKAEQYISVNTNTVYDVAFKGNKVSVIKSVKDGDETALLSEYLSDSNLFLPYAKDVAKQVKYNEDLGTLASVTSEIRKLLDNGHVICHAKANSDIEGLVEYTIMVGESK